MLDGKMVFPIVGQRFVEAAIFFRGNIGRISSPQWFGLVQFLVFLGDFLDLLGLLLLVGLFIDLLNLGFLIFSLFLFRLFFLFLDFLLSFFGD